MNARKHFGAATLRLRICAAASLLLMLAASRSTAYVTSKLLSATNQIAVQKWAAFPITWSMNPAVGSNVTGTREQADVFRQSFAAWAGIPTASISFSQGQAQERNPAFDGINLITTSWPAGEYPSEALGISLIYAFNSAGGVDEFGRPIQFAGQIMEVDIAFNPEEPFTTNETAVPGSIDLQSTATHEIGHLLGLDHTTLLSSTMFPTVSEGVNYKKTLSADDMIGISTTYPNATFAARGTIEGVVRTTTSAPVYGAIVVAVNSDGQPVASALTNPSGAYTIAGLNPGAYTIYAEPMDSPFQVGNLSTLQRIYPGSSVNTAFTTRYR